MRKLIRDKVTKGFVTQDGQWTSQDSLACDFYLNPKAAELQSKMLTDCDRNLEWFYTFDGPDAPQYDFATSLC